MEIYLIVYSTPRGAVRCRAWRSKKLAKRFYEHIKSLGIVYKDAGVIAFRKVFL